MTAPRLPSWAVLLGGVLPFGIKWYARHVRDGGPEEETVGLESDLRHWKR